jgi:hypothetical protein
MKGGTGRIIMSHVGSIIYCSARLHVRIAAPRTGTPRAPGTLRKAL